MDDLRIKLYDARPDAASAYGGLHALGICPPTWVEALRVRKLVTAGRRAHAERRTAPLSPAADAGRLVAAARNGEPFPDGFGIDPDAATRVRAHEQAAWARAEGDAATGLYGVVQGDALAIYTGPLRHELGTILQAVRDDSATPALVSRYRLIREAQVRLRPFIGRTNHDTTELLWEIANLESLFGPARWISARQNLDAWRPGPADPIKRLDWLASEAVKTWLPLPGEQDAAFIEGHLEAKAKERDDFQERRAEAASRGQILERVGVTEEEWRQERYAQKAAPRGR